VFFDTKCAVGIFLVCSRNLALKSIVIIRVLPFFNRYIYCIIVNTCQTLTHYTIKQSNLFTGLLSVEESVSESLTFSLDQAMSRTFDLSPACFLTIGIGQAGNTTAVVKHNADRITCFNSHARNTEGLQGPCNCRRHFSTVNYAATHNVSVFS